jgi:formamidopyrimidine-DNA glycosylase
LPELPEVETVRRGLEDRLKHFYVQDIEVLSERTISSIGGTSVFNENIKGSILGNWTRRGKYLICYLQSQNSDDHAGWLVVHLRMTGQFKWLNSKQLACSHTRVRFWNSIGNEIRFVDTRNFGQMWWVSPEHKPSEKVNGLMRLGPEPFSNDFNPVYLKNSLSTRKRSIKASLLDQTVVAGAGNIYADESLFEAGIIPTKESRNLSEIEINRLCNSLIRVLRISIGKGGTSFKDFRDLEGTNGNYGGEAWVYGRANKSCKKCGTKIMKKKLSGRGTHWCPNCQK